MSDPPIDLLTPINRAVLAHLDGKSAHSDVAGSLTEAVKPLGDVQLFCPNWHHYRYVAGSTKGVIFAIAVGMNVIAVRLDERMKQRALRTGAVAYPECGEDWVAVVHPEQDADWPAVDTRFWARKAYVYARESAAASRP